ncbi:MAG TPA: GGDEF domain-containing protein [Acidimicrobiales bacterium]|nr:GGDEF domain-containing protein [Acidimicrobiales bacterium]
MAGPVPLSEGEALFVAQAFSQSHDLFVVADVTLTIRFVSAGALPILGEDPESAIGRNGLEYLHPEDAPILAMVAGAVQEESYRPRTTNLLRLRHASGEYVMMELSGGPIHGDHGVVGFWLMGRRPVRVEIHAEVLRRILHEQPLAVALENVPNTVSPESGNFVCLTGWPADEPRFTLGHRLPGALNGRELRAGSPWAEAVRTGEPVAVDDMSALEPELAALAEREGMGSVFVAPVKGPDGTCGALLTVGMSVGLPPPRGLYHAIQLTTDLIEAAFQLRDRFTSLRRQAGTDPLTGLANRRRLLEAFSIAPQDETTSLLMIDLDGFKTVNDAHGHEVGDKVLSKVAKRLEASARQGDLVTRIGGDEFVILCQGCDEAQMAGITARILEAAAEPFDLDGRRLKVGASVGTARGPGTLDELLRRADDALYEAKRAVRSA